MECPLLHAGVKRLNGFLMNSYTFKGLSMGTKVNSRSEKGLKCQTPTYKRIIIIIILLLVVLLLITSSTTLSNLIVLNSCYFVLNLTTVAVPRLSDK